MRAVSNTSPISNLAVIGKLGLLTRQFTKIWIPSAVSQELAAHRDPAAIAAIESAVREGWIEVAPVEDSPLLKTLSSQLHRGEAEAIALAAALKTDFVLIDEQEGRQFAAQSGLAVTGVLGVLLRAKRLGDIPKIKPELEALRTKGRFFIAQALEARVLSEAGE